MDLKDENILKGIWWNHRVVMDTTEDETSWGIYEVHYKDGEPVAFGDVVSLISYEEDYADELRVVMTRCFTALQNPPLTWDGEVFKELED